MLRTVLLPIDFSADSDLVLRFCTGLSELGTRRVVCCHVVDATGLEGPVIAAKLDAARQRMRAATKPLVDAGFDVEVRLPTGDPETELLAVATESHIDAVVCGSSGKTLADRLLSGSVSERLASSSGIPALTVRYDLLRSVGDPAALAKGFARMMLVPTDFSGTAARALNVALSIPKRAVGTIRVLHILPEAKDAVARCSRRPAPSSNCATLWRSPRSAGCRRPRSSGTVLRSARSWARSTPAACRVSSSGRAAARLCRKP